MKPLTLRPAQQPERRSFLTRTAAAGTLATLSSVTSPGWALAVDSPAEALTREQAASKAPPAGRDLRALAHTDFEPLLGQSFRLTGQGGRTSRARLLEVTSCRHAPGPACRRQAFSLIFEVPTGVDRIQGSYRLKHRQIGELKLFMVPVDLATHSRRLEAVFT